MNPEIDKVIDGMARLITDRTLKLEKPLGEMLSDITVSHYPGITDAVLRVPSKMLVRVCNALNSHDDLIAAMHHISLVSKNSMGSKEECGRIARAALAKVKGE